MSQATKSLLNCGTKKQSWERCKKKPIVRSFLLPLESPQKNDVNRHAKDGEDNITTMARCKHLSAIKDLMKQFVDNFSLFASKDLKKGWKCKALHKEEILTNGVVLIILNDEETKDAISFSEENKDEMPTMTKRDIQEFKDTNNVLNLSIFKFIKH